MICSTCHRPADAGLRCPQGRLHCPACFDRLDAGPAPAPDAPSGLPPLWPHQVRGIAGVQGEYRRGNRWVVLTSPTGGGKTRMASEIVARAVGRGRRVAVFTSRKLLLTQMGEALARRGVGHGVMADGHGYDPGRAVQLCSLQTIDARVFRAGQWSLPAADLVVVDEARSNKAATAARLIAHYKTHGAYGLGLDATPLGLAGLYDALVTAGTVSELQAAGHLVPCVVYAPEEPDFKGISLVRDVKAARKRIHWVIKGGDICGQWLRANPQRLPTILWAPGVAESRWFAERYFPRRMVTAAHLDGTTTDAERRDIFAAHRERRVEVICSCDVLREGVDLPWAACGIFLRPAGKLSAYLQPVGRLLRADAPSGKTHAILLDYSGCWHRHGSPNEDREWTLGLTDARARQARRKALRAGEAKDPVRCPKCGGVRPAGPECPRCGHKHVRSIRMVRMEDGSLKRMVGAVTPAAKAARLMVADERTWKKCLNAAVYGKRQRTVKQAVADFRRRTGKWPRDIPGVPNPGSIEWDRYVGEVYPDLKPPRSQ